MACMENWSHRSQTSPASIITGCDVCDIGTTAGSAGYAMDATNATDVTGERFKHDRKKHYKPQLSHKIIQNPQFPCVSVLSRSSNRGFGVI